jgi:hypothetical protein
MKHRRCKKDSAGLDAYSRRSTHVWGVQPSRLFSQTYLYCPVAVDYSPREKRRHSGRGSAECGADCDSAHDGRVAPNDGQLGTGVKSIPSEP